MTTPIINHDMIRTKARNAFYRGDNRDACALPPSSAARQTWMLEFDRLQKESQGEVRS